MSDATQENTPQDSEQPAPEVTPEAEAPAEEAAPEGTEAAPIETEEAKAETEEQKHQRKGGWQRKIERLEAINQALLDRLAAAGQSVPAPTEPKKKTPDEEAAEYVNALVEKRLAAEREAQRQAAAQAEFAQRTQAVRAEHPDFDEVISAADVPVSQALGEALLTSEQGPRIMYQLAANPAELARINALPPIAAAREIGRLEARLASGTAAPSKPTHAVAPRKSAVPAPITPVTTRGPTAVKDPSAMTFEEYAAWRRQTGR